RRFYRDGKAVQWAARAVKFIETAGLGADTIRVEVGECVQLRIEPGDLLNVRFGQIDNGQLATAQKFQLSNCRFQNYIAHGRSAALIAGASSSAGVDCSCR